jgi:hypothetical protein
LTADTRVIAKAIHPLPNCKGKEEPVANTESKKEEEQKEKWQA